MQLVLRQPVMQLTLQLGTGRIGAQKHLPLDGRTDNGFRWLPCPAHLGDSKHRR